ncbi:DEAD/DEAH box helicase [Geosporobacter ferrireducens]|uniref:ATP-dependent RNA helicase CshA n=1 Tax=Geosporobacter ferrireducens TaxID=1424294 RepID=A0A1D8GC59_9FIRM|nr:DEAD/DEAH box helicase [Geosporobacter ferrireducens]AOT68493.1 ATP-dependent RNA helicase [Geosporobacter ferrireducens]MTI53955.1 DEAD/DEAH box helicase [Geosporobacter ferrireducens]
MNNITFKQLGLMPEILKAIDALGYEEPTPIQKAAMPAVMDGKDIIGQAQTGTGKTAAFSMPVIQKLSLDVKGPQALILTPTRELAVQVADEISKFSKYLSGVKTLAIYGGQPIERQIKALKAGVQIVVGTPGRMIDHINRKTIKLNNVHTVVLDEADQMLDMGFLEDIERILQETPENRQTLLFSATMPKEIENLARNYQKKPEKIKVVHEVLTVPLIEQYYYEVKPHEKLEVLTRLLDMEKEGLTIIFCRTKKGVDELVESLQSRGYFSEGLHGDLKQSQRDRVMKKFREGTVDLLVATDVAARGLDVNNVHIVINYDIPEDLEYYVHRIGRTGRAGKAGVTYTFVTGRQIGLLKSIERFTKSKIRRKPIPSVNDLAERQREVFKKRIVSTIEAGHLTPYISLTETLAEEYSSIEVAAALAKIIMEKERTGLVDRSEDLFDDTGATESDKARIFINIGKRDRIRAADILGAVANEGGISGREVGTIDLFDKYAFVEVPKNQAAKLVKKLNKIRIKGKKINAEPANQR